LREHIVEFLIVVIAVIVLGVIAMVTTRVADAWTYIYDAAYESEICRSGMVKEALFRSPYIPDGVDGMRAHVFDLASRHVEQPHESGFERGVRATVRNLWLHIFAGDREIAAAYCELAGPRTLASLVKTLNIQNIHNMSEQELAAVIDVYGLAMQSPRSDEELIRMWRERRPVVGGR
jgi:hypothetical protein